VFASLISKIRRWLKGRALVVAIVLVVALVVVVALVAFGGSDSPKGGRAPGAGSVSTPAGAVVVTIVGKVNTILPNGDFVVNDGHADYTIAMSSTASIVDLNGAVVTAKLIQLDGSVQITGTLEGSTISAQKVIVPTSQEPAPTTT
jgi:hypothetical protein